MIFVDPFQLIIRFYDSMIKRKTHGKNTTRGASRPQNPFTLWPTAFHVLYFPRKRVIKQEWVTVVGPLTSRVNTALSYSPARTKPNFGWCGSIHKRQIFCPQMARRHQGNNHLQNFGISRNLFFKPPAFKAEIQDPHTGRGADVGHTASFLGLLGVLLASVMLGGSRCGLLDFPMSAEKNSQCQSHIGCDHNPDAFISPWILERVLWTGGIPHSLESPASVRSCRQTYEVHMNL